jgi:Fe-S-cluster-containing hydrogenase component 2
MLYSAIFSGPVALVGEHFGQVTVGPHFSCVSACPVGAMIKDPETGIVHNEPSKCIGCRYCMVACPFNSIKFEWNKTFPDARIVDDPPVTLMPVDQAFSQKKNSNAEHPQLLPKPGESPNHRGP